MRNTIVYVLRLLADDAEPEGLHGVLRDVITGEEQSFASGQGLLELLSHRPTHKPDPTDLKQSAHSRNREP